MKSILRILLLTLITQNAFSQIQDTVLRYSRTSPRWVVSCGQDGIESCILNAYFPDGRQKAQVGVTYFDRRNRFRPNGNAIIYSENGQIIQEYNHSTGILLTYYNTGELKEKMITPIDGDMEYKYKYYKNGQLWEEEVSKHEVGRQNLQFGYSSNRDYIYDNHGYSYNYYKTYHSNGNLMSHIHIDKTAPHLKYVREYYAIDGSFDPDAIYNKVSGRNMK